MKQGSERFGDVQVMYVCSSFFLHRSMFEVTSRLFDVTRWLHSLMYPHLFCIDY